MKRRAQWLTMFVWSSSIGSLVWLYMLATRKTSIGPIRAARFIAQFARGHADEAVRP